MIDTFYRDPMKYVYILGVTKFTDGLPRLSRFIFNRLANAS